MRKLLVVALFGALLAGPLAARAEDPPDAATIAKARELLEASNWVQSTGNIMTLLSQGMEGLIERANPGREADIRDFMTKYFLPEIRKRLPEMEDIMAAEYARYFTIGDMDQMIAFYRSDVGRKVIAVQPKLAKELYALGSSWGERVAEEVFRKLEPQLKNRGLKSPNT
jgi:uncharacterized protein